MSRSKRGRQQRPRIQEARRPVAKQLEFTRSRLNDGTIEFIAYGSANEVGRSSFILQDKERTILLDAGIKLQPFKPSLHPEGLVDHTPELDAIVLSHAHVDHSGFVPALYENGFEGNTYMTDPTLDISLMLWNDHLKIEGERYWTEDALDVAYGNTVTMRYGRKQRILDDITLEFYNGGHILGSAISVIDWDGYRILYTGDINDKRTPLFNGFKLPEVDEPFDLVITEGTNGCGPVPQREKTNKNFVHKALDVLNQGHKVLVPTFAVGRGQELLIVLTESIKDFPIFVDGMINKMNKITERYLTPEWVDQPILDRLREEGRSSPFDYENIFPIDRDNYDRPHDFRKHLGDSDEPGIICSTSGMLMPSPMHLHLRYHGVDPDNMLAFVGYQAEGTIGREILDGKRKISLSADFRNKTVEVEIKAKVLSFRFSGHTSKKGIKALLRKTKPENTIFIHSESTSASDLQNEVSLPNSYTPNIRVPLNFEK